MNNFWWVCRGINFDAAISDAICEARQHNTQARQNSQPSIQKTPLIASSGQSEKLEKYLWGKHQTNTYLTSCFPFCLQNNHIPDWAAFVSEVLQNKEAVLVYNHGSQKIERIYQPP
jgi:hypothetical protein